MSPTLPITEDQVYAVLGDPDDYKTNTRRQRFFSMSGLFNSRVYLDLNLGNPLDGIETPKEGDPRERTFSVQEIHDLLVSAETLQEVTFILLILDTGIRVGEAASITIDAMQDGELSVIGKNGARKVPVSPRMEYLLKQTANGLGERLVRRTWAAERRSARGAVPSTRRPNWDHRRGPWTAHPPAELSRPVGRETTGAGLNFKK